MFVHKGGQINHVQLITGVWSAEMSHLQNRSVKISKEHCRQFEEKKNETKNDTKNLEKWGRVGCGGGGGNPELKLL